MGSTFGISYSESLDGKRIKTQMQVIRDYMLDNQDKYLSLKHIELATGYPQSSISAQLRHLKKPQFGSYIFDKHRLDHSGTWVYNLKSPMPLTQLELFKEVQQCK